MYIYSCVTCTSMRCIFRMKLHHSNCLGQLMGVACKRTCAQVLQTSKAACSIAVYGETASYST